MFTTSLTGFLLPVQTSLTLNGTAIVLSLTSNSNYEKEHQSHLFVDYVKGLYKVLDRLKTKYPKIPMMLCSGGGGRTDYEALRYFTEFWASDNTDPIDRLYIQWGFSHIFPAKTICAHVTEWNRKVDLKLS